MESTKEDTVSASLARRPMETGKSFKILTRKHLAKFGLTPETYREKWGYPKNMPLVCKELQRERRKKMKQMKLWEKRIKQSA